MVNVYEHDDQGDGNGRIIGRVKYNNRLDRWDGHNRTNGGTGMHKGITRLTKSGRMVIIVGTQWQGRMNYAYTVSDEEALQEILSSGNHGIVDDYPQVAKLYNEQETD